MAPTPQITLRVDEERRERWKQATDAADLNVSEVIRQLMDAWADRVLSGDFSSGD